MVLREGLGRIKCFVCICYGSSDMYGGNSWAGKNEDYKNIYRIKKFYESTQEEEISSW